MMLAYWMMLVLHLITYIAGTSNCNSIFENANSRLFSCFKNQCPYDPLEECKGKGMGSMHMTCGDMKEMYKEAMCCGNPEKQVTLGMK